MVVRDAGRGPRNGEGRCDFSISRHGTLKSGCEYFLGKRRPIKSASVCKPLLPDQCHLRGKDQAKLLLFNRAIWAHRRIIWSVSKICPTCRYSEFS